MGMANYFDAPETVQGALALITALHAVDHGLGYSVATVDSAIERSRIAADLSKQRNERVRAKALAFCDAMGIVEISDDVLYDAYKETLTDSRPLTLDATNV